MGNRDGQGAEAWLGGGGHFPGPVFLALAPVPSRSVAPRVGQRPTCWVGEEERQCWKRRLCSSHRSLHVEPEMIPFLYWSHWGGEGRERQLNGCRAVRLPVRPWNLGVSRETWGTPNRQFGECQLSGTAPLIASPASPQPWVQHQGAVPGTTSSPPPGCVGTPHSRDWDGSVPQFPH